MKKLLFIFLCCYFSSFAQQKEWSIEDCMEYAIKNNLTVQQQTLLQQEAELNINDAKGAFYQI